MAIVVTPFPDIKSVLGPSWRKQMYQLHPGAPSDYPTGGYPVTAAACELGLLSGAKIVGMNAAGAAYQAKCVFPAGSFGTVPAPATQFLLEVTQGDTQVAANTDLSSVYWLAECDGW